MMFATRSGRGCALFATALTAVGTAAAQSFSGDALTPERAVAIALAHHPALAVSASETDAARADLRLARSGWLPRVTIEEEVVRSTNPTFVFASKLGQERFGEQDFDVDALNRPQALTNAATRLALRQNVWDAGRTHLGGLAAARGVEAAAGGESRTAQAVAFGARRAFWDAALADELVASAAAGERAAEENLRLAAARAEEGLAVPSDRMQAEVRLAEVRALRFRAEEGVSVARAGLRVALGRREDGAFLLAAPEVRPDDAAAEDVDALVVQALAARADLEAIAARAEQAGIGERMARSARLPEIGLAAAYERNAERPFAKDGDNWTVGATARWTVFDGLETNARVARARAELARAVALRAQAQEGAGFEVRAAVARRHAAAERLRAATSAVTLSGEALRIVRERYGEGLAVMVELLGAEAAHTAARAARAEAARDLAVARAALDFAVGRPAAATPPTPTTGELR